MKKQHFLLLFLVSIVSCNSSKQNYDKWFMFESTKYNFTIKYPSNWSEGTGTDGQYFYVSEDQVPDKWNEIVNLKSNFEIVINPSRFETIEQAGIEYEEHILNPKVFQNTKILSRENIIFQNQDALQFIGRG